ncbi:MAG: hypothetical protein HWE30_02220 [Methylocystaceae bacterium]|nr:hypothetical protein [Methylocystaceae bacterium]
MQTKQKNTDDGRFIDLIPAICIGMLIIISVAILTIFNVSKSSLVAVVFPPWVSEEQAFQLVIEADASVVRLGLSGQIVVAKPQSAEFKNKIIGVGAWAVVNPLAFGGCGTGRQITKDLHQGPLVSMKSAGRL